MSILQCAWVTTDPLYVEYHNNEWGRPIVDNQLLFEYLNLEGAQAGLSWITILKRRLHYKQAFDNFNPHLIANYDENKIAILLNNPHIIRNRQKIAAFIKNAKAYLILQSSQEFSNFLWNFVDGKPICNEWTNASEVPIESPISIKMAKELKVHGFKFVGSKICYAFMQAVGMVNDHLITCEQHECIKKQKFSLDRKTSKE